MLEVLVKRHYREHALSGLSERAEEGRSVAVADYRISRVLNFGADGK